MKTKVSDYHQAGVGVEPIHYPMLVNKQGEMVLLPKADLRVDKTYQRDINKRAVYRIANNWNWVAAGVLIVSLRKDGYYIIDGQHRWEAANELKEIKTLACLAFEIKDIRDEAVGFLAANTERQVPQMIHRFRALVTIKDKTALVADELSREAGRIIQAPSSKTNLSCIGELMRTIRIDEKTIRRLWPLIIRLSQDQVLPGRLIKGIFNLERRMPKGYSLSDRKLFDRLVHIGLDPIIQSIKTVAAIEGNSNERTCANGVLRALNKGVRNPIHIDLN